MIGDGNMKGYLLGGNSIGSDGGSDIGCDGISDERDLWNIVVGS